MTWLGRTSPIALRDAKSVVDLCKIKRSSRFHFSQRTWRQPFALVVSTGGTQQDARVIWWLSGAVKPRVAKKAFGQLGPLILVAQQTCFDQICVLTSNKLRGS